jgi:hypothetical protein
MALSNIKQTALLADSRIYLSSSISGGGGTPFLLNINARSPEDPQLNQALSKCMIMLETTSFDTTVKAHSNRASCGEMTCLRQWDISTVDVSLTGLTGMIVTVCIYTLVFPKYLTSAFWLCEQS